MNTAVNQRPDRIVVVDDDARIRDLLRRYLTQEGFEVLLAEDAKALNRLLTRETVHLIVLDSLPRRERIVTERGADSRHLVGRHGRADAAAADEDPAPAFPRRDGLSHASGEIRIIGGLRVEGPQVGHLVLRREQHRHDLLLHRESGVIASDRDLHRSAFARFTTFATLNPSSSSAFSPGAEAPYLSTLTESPRSPT